MFVSKPADRQVHFKAPTGMAGATKVEIEIPLNLNMCSFEMWPANTPQPGHNWLEAGKSIDAGYGADTALAPGAYQLALTSCEGNVHVADTVKIARDSEIEIQYRELIRKPLDTREHLYIVVAPTPRWIIDSQNTPGYTTEGSTTDCVADQHLTHANGADCCSGVSHGNPDVHQPDICGPLP